MYGTALRAFLVIETSPTDGGTGVRLVSIVKGLGHEVSIVHAVALVTVEDKERGVHRQSRVAHQSVFLLIYYIINARPASARKEETGDQTN
jgi:hypothetical protein